jgi:predicted ester cyclase
MVMFRKMWMVVVMLVLIASVPALAQNAACDEAQLRAGVQRVIDEGFNQGNTAVVDETFADSYIRHPDDGNRENFKETITALRSAMPQGEASIEHVLVQGCDLFFLFHFHGTLENPLELIGQPPLPATGKPLDLEAQVYVRFDDQGKVAEEWDYTDNLSLLIQTGVIPMQAEATAEPEVAETGMTAALVTMSGNEARNTDMVNQAFEQGFNQGNMETLRELYTPDFMGHTGGTRTADALFASISALRSAMPDIHLTVNGSVAEGDYVASRVTVTGTFQNPLPYGGQTVPPTGKPVTIEFSFLHRLTPEGLIAEDWDIYDRVSFLSQIGLFEASPGAEMTPEVTPGV